MGRKWDSKMESLVGKLVTKVSLDAERQILTFETTTGQVRYQADGDCCSASYFHDILGAESLVGQVVTGVEDIELPHGLDFCSPDSTLGPYYKFYGHKIRTAKGYFDIIYRNESNGYYGGCLVELDVDDED